MSEIVKKAVLGSVGAAGLFLASGAVVNASDVHTVVSNDTFWSLAHKYGVSQHTLEKQIISIHRRILFIKAKN